MRMTLIVLLALVCMPGVGQQTVVVVPRSNVVVLPPAPDYLGNFIRSLNDKAEHERQRQHELEMQREWIEAQKSLQQQLPNNTASAQDLEKAEFICNLLCNA